MFNVFFGKVKMSRLKHLQLLGHSLLILILLGLLIGIGFAGVLIVEMDEIAGAAMHIIGGDFQQEVELLDGAWLLLFFSGISSSFSLFCSF